MSDPRIKPDWLTIHEEKENGRFTGIEKRLDDGESDRDRYHEEHMEGIDEIKKHMKRVEPMIKSYEENLVFMNGLKKKGQIALYLAGAVITLAGAWYVIRNWILLALSIRH